VEEFVDKKTIKNDRTIEFEWKYGFVNFFDFLINAAFGPARGQRLLEGSAHVKIIKVWRLLVGSA